MTKKLLLAAMLLTSLGASARADDASTPTPPAAGAPAGDHQRLRDGSGAGGQRGYGPHGGAGRGTCDGSMARDRMRDGSGGRRGRMSGGCRR